MPFFEPRINPDYNSYQTDNGCLTVKVIGYPRTAAVYEDSRTEGRYRLSLAHLQGNYVFSLFVTVYNYHVFLI